MEKLEQNNKSARVKELAEKRNSQGLTFDERCELARLTSIDVKMTYEQRLAELKSRYGL